MAASVIGFGGLATAAGALKMVSNPEDAPAWIKWSSLSALLGIAADAANYYMHLNIKGNYYAWFLIGPLAACIAYIGLIARMRSGKKDL